MRQIDRMTPEEIEDLKLKGMLPGETPAAPAASDQPQPQRSEAEAFAALTADALDDSDDQPRPSGQEWTPEYVKQLVYPKTGANLRDDVAVVISDAHKVALAGCTCQRCGSKYLDDVRVPDELWERIKPESKAVGAGLLCGQCIFNAARAAAENAEVQRLRDLAMDIVELKRQLAAEREKRQEAEKAVHHRWSSTKWYEKYRETRDQLAAARELREGDNKLIRALAEDAGIKITASDKLLGAQWEQFHDGVMKLKDNLATEREKVRELERITSATGREAALRQQLARQQAAIDAALKAPWTDVGQILAPIGDTALREHDAAKFDDLMKSHERALAEQREKRKPLVEALEWYAAARYPDDGSGRPPEAFQRRAKDALAKVK